MTSPGSRVQNDDTNCTNSETPRIISFVLARCPSTRVPSACSTTVTISRSEASSTVRWVTIQGPRGQNVSKPFARPHCTSDFCRSRALTSLATVYPKITSATRSAGTSRQMRPMTTASSPS